MKQSEARILVFLDQAIIERCFARELASKLRMDYIYLLRVLAEMVEKHWVIKSYGRQNKRYYRISKRNIKKLKEAKELMSK